MTTTTTATPSIDWDEWGVPHITAGSDAEVCHGIGQAQAIAHATQVLERYGISRGTAAARWGASFADQDVIHAQLGLDEVVDAHLAAQEPATLKRIQAFCDGFNAACEAQPELGGERRDVLPVTPRDVVGHVTRIILNFITMSDTSARAFGPGGTGGVPAAAAAMAGSSAWAVSGERSTTGGALLVLNPHLLWEGYHRWFEVRTTSPGRDFHGVCLIGVPWQGMGFGRSAGWAHTVGPHTLLSTYLLDVEHGTYAFDGGRRELEVTERRIAVAGAEDRVVQVRRSVHGPVVTAPDGADVAVRAAGILDHPVASGLEGWWRLSTATSVAEQLVVVDSHPLPMFSFLGADVDGHIAAVHCGRPPRREHGSHAEWSARVPGDDPRFLYEGLHDAAAMPRVVDPPSGWVQNCNDGPWWFTEPRLDPATFPPVISTPLTQFPDERSAVSRRFLADRVTANGAISPQDLLELKWLDHAVLADVVVDQLIEAAEQESDLAEAVAALRAYDRRGHVDSAGQPLVELSLLLCAPVMTGDRPLLVPSEEPGGLPQGLADPAAAVAGLRMAAGIMTALGVPLDATLGQAAEMRDGGTAVPADGVSTLLGGFKALAFLPSPGRWQVHFGDTFIALVEFAAGGPPTAHGLLVYGNSTEPGAPHATSQIELFAANQLRPIKQPS